MVAVALVVAMVEEEAVVAGPPPDELLLPQHQLLHPLLTLNNIALLVPVSES